MSATSQSHGEFVRLMAAVNAGDADAARKLHEQFGPYILRAVRRRLAARMRSRFDSIDFTQDVWASFFTGPAKRFEVTKPEQLIGLLTTMARNKVVTAVRQRLQDEKKNKFGCEVLLSDQADGGVHFVSPQQSPSQIVMGEEAWQILLARQPPVYRCILIMLRKGKTHETIARELRVSLRTVRRVAEKLNQ